MKIGKFNQVNSVNTSEKQKGNPKNINDLQAGDKFKATILDIKRSEVTIRLTDGSTITAKSLIIPDARIGETMEFTVQANKDGQILLSMFSEEQGKQQQLNTLLKILFSANIMPSEEAIAVVKSLMNNDLPVDKNTIQNILQTLKADPDLDMDTLAFMLKEDIPITEKNIEQLKLTAHNENKIINQIDELAFKIAGIDEPDIRKQVLDLFLPELSVEDSENKMTNNISTNIKEFISVQQQQIAAKLEIPEQKQMFKEVTDFISDKIISNDETITVKAKDIIKNGGDIKSVIETIIKQYPDKSRLFNEVKNDDKLMNTLKEFFDKLLELETPKKFIKPEVLAKHIKESLFINPKEDTFPEDLNKYYKQLHEKVAKALLITENGGSENTREASKILSEVKENIEFMNNINKFEEFIQIPFKLGDANNQGDLYIFKDKKGKKISKDKASVLLTLDLSMLGHFEVFVQKDFKNISCQFRTIDKKIQSLVQISIHELQSSLKQRGYTLSQVMYKTIEEPFSILQSAEEVGFENNEQTQQTNKRYSFDMRA